MQEAIFNIINQNKNITIQCEYKEPMDNIIKKFFTKYATNNENLESFCFKYNGKEIKPDLTFEQLLNENDKRNNSIYITVESKIETEDIKNSFSQNINTINNNNSQNIINDENKNNQPNEPSESNNNYDNYNTNSNSNSYAINTNSTINDIDKSINKLLLFKSNPKELKNIFRNNKKEDFICQEYSDGQKHNEKYLSYCLKCKKNLCFLCTVTGQHSNHVILKYAAMYKSKKELERKMKQRKEQINSYIEILEKAEQQLKNLKESMLLDLEINNNFVKGYDPRNRNIKIFLFANDIHDKFTIFYDANTKFNIINDIINNFNNSLSNIINSEENLVNDNIDFNNSLNINNNNIMDNNIINNDINNYHFNEINNVNNIINNNNYNYMINNNQNENIFNLNYGINNNNYNNDNLKYNFQNSENISISNLNSINNKYNIDYNSNNNYIKNNENILNLNKEAKNDNVQKGKNENIKFEVNDIKNKSDFN